MTVVDAMLGNAAVAAVLALLALAVGYAVPFARRAPRRVGDRAPEARDAPALQHSAARAAGVLGRARRGSDRRRHRFSLVFLRC